MISLLVAATMLGQDPDGMWTVLGDPDLPTTRLKFYTGLKKLSPPKYTPQKFNEPPKPLEFEWQDAGYGRINPDRDPIYKLRFRVFEQQRKTEGDIAPMVTRMLLRIWDLNIRKLRIDHAVQYNNQIVDVYLCWGSAGTPGGEQRFDVDNEGGKERSVNTIYIYDLPSFKEPVEMAREVAHEYGHATLSPIGGFKTPEDWGNGQLGEKMYMKWIRDEMAAKRLEPVDAMGATLPQLTAWVRQNVDPLVQMAAEKGPRPSLLEGTGQQAMDACNGLILYMEQLLPPNIFTQSLRNLGGSVNAKDYLRALNDAVTAKDAVALNIPNEWKSIAIWVPTGANGQIQSGTIVRREGDWSLVRPGITGVVSITNKPNEEERHLTRRQFPGEHVDSLGARNKAERRPRYFVE